MSSHFVCDYLENDEERTEGVVVCQSISGNPQLEEEILPRLCPSSLGASCDRRPS